MTDPMSQQQPATAAEAAQWLRTQGYGIIDLGDGHSSRWLVQPFPNGGIIDRRSQARFSDHHLIDFTKNRQAHLAAGSEAWLQDTKEE